MCLENTTNKLTFPFRLSIIDPYTYLKDTLISSFSSKIRYNTTYAPVNKFAGAKIAPVAQWIEH